jgi:hypothetical protein
MNSSILQKCSTGAVFRMNGTGMRPFSVAYNIKSKFENAYNEKVEIMSKVKKEV